MPQHGAPYSMNVHTQVKNTGQGCNSWNIYRGEAWGKSEDVSESLDTFRAATFGG